MAEKRARHAFGESSGIEAAKRENKINEFDILFLDGSTEPKIGWLDSKGDTVIIDHRADLAKVETKLEGQILTKANAKDVEDALSKKVDAEEVDAKIAAALSELELDVEVDMDVDYEISYKPDGTLVDYREKEIRIMIPAGTKFELQNSGENADANSYYIGFKAYAPDEAVSFKEDLNKTIVDEEMYYFEGNEFAGIDENGKKYSIVWLPVAKYDGSTWTYSGANSREDKFLGWFYSVQWYDANGVIIASDCIRINLSNENCHSVIKSYYGVSETEEIETKVEEVVEEKITEKVSEAVATSNAYTDAQIKAKMAEIEEMASYEVVEF